MIEFKEFTKGDWNAFQGAEPFADGQGPLTGDIATIDGKEAFVLIDGFGVTVVVEDSSYTFSAKLRRQAAIAIANILLENIKTTIELEFIGFERT